MPTPTPVVPLVAPVKSITETPQPMTDPALLPRAPGTAHSRTSQLLQAPAPAILLMWIWQGMLWDPSGRACSSCSWFAKRAWHIQATQQPLLQDLVR